MIAAILLFAAIITERNDWNTIPPNYATFAGTAAAPGIASCWIPYGTYTDGTGGTEYLRVTSNLTGVVASMLGGIVERRVFDYNDLPSIVGNPNTNDFKFLCFPVTNFFLYSDANLGGYLATNNTRRILDVLNRPPVFPRIWGSYIYPGSLYEDIYGAGTSPESLEEALATTSMDYEEDDAENRDYYQYHTGLSANFGGRNLDELETGGGASIEPPIGTTWTEDIPFRAADSNLWATVWPIYAALTNDTHFYRDHPSTNLNYGSWYPRRELRKWIIGENSGMDADPLAAGNLWGSDVWGDEGDGAARDLCAALWRIPLPYTMENVLSVDTGWSYEVPPVITSSYWTVSGPLGNFTMSESSDNYWVGQDKSVPGEGDGMLAEIWYENGIYRLVISDAWSTAWLFVRDVAGDEWSMSLDFGEYQATRTAEFSNKDDFTHWRNGTRRLDWKRLGIICQLERQMETTYKARGSEDYLPYVSKYCQKGMVWRGEIEVDLTTNEIEIAVADVSWTFVTNTVSTSTNATGWSFPTARAPAPSLNGGVTGSGNGGTIYLTKDDFQSMLENCDGLENVSDGTNLLLVASVNGFTVSGDPPGISLDLYYFDISSYPDDLNCRLNPFLVPFGGATNATIALSRGVDKEVHATWTYSNADMTPEIKSRFAAYPDANTWSNNYVAAQTRPTLDFMFSATGITAGDYLYFSTNRTEIPAVAWDHIPAHTSNFTTNRYWRMNPVCAEESTRSDSDVNRHNMLIDLNNSVAAKFKNHTTFDVNNVEGRATITQNEETRICGELDNKTVAIHPVIAPWFNWTDGRSDLWGFGAKMEARFDLVDGVVTNFVPLNVHLEGSIEDYVDITYSYADENGDIAIGSFHWQAEEVTVGETNNYQSVVVDGHQDQMIKTLWRFKNLRDPNL